MSLALDLRAEARGVLLALALTSEVRARAFLPAVSVSPPSSAPPPGEGEPRAEALAAELGAAGDDVEAIAGVLRKARAELSVIKRRPLAKVHGETAEDLRGLVIDRGAGFTALEVSIALKVTPTFVRKARLAAGREPERGRPARVNGARDLGVELIANGLSVRAASAISGVARSTMHDRARRAASSSPGA
jgi:hypothetical protein